MNRIFVIFTRLSFCAALDSHLFFWQNTMKWKKGRKNGEEKKAKCSKHPLRTTCEKANIFIFYCSYFFSSSPLFVPTILLLLLFGTHLVFFISFALVHYKMLKLHCITPANGIKCFMCFIARPWRQTIRCRKDLDMATETCTSAGDFLHSIFFWPTIVLMPFAWMSKNK